MRKILISDNLSPEGLEIFKKIPGIEVDSRSKMTADELKAIIKDYDALVIRSATRVTQEIIDLADKLVIIGRAGIGLDNVDIPAATKRGIVVMNTPGGNAVTTGEHAIAMMLSLVRHIPQATASMKAGKWEKNKFTGHEFLNKTLGIVGIGRVGSIVADRAQGLKMKVLAYDPFITPEVAEKAGITLASLDEIYAQADIITIHTPMTKETRGLINAAAFAKMKKGVYIVNCARGGLVSEKDLYDALRSGKVAGAALDVFEEEPPKNMDADRTRQCHLHAPPGGLHRRGPGQRRHRHRRADLRLPDDGRDQGRRELPLRQRGDPCGPASLPESGGEAREI